MRSNGRAAVAAMTALVASGIVLVASAPAQAGVHTATFSYNGTDGWDGSVQTWTVPAGVHRATFVLQGASGAQSAFFGALGGHGARVEATIPVTPGAELQILVGGKPPGNGPQGGGWNGGGGWGHDAALFAYSGGGGGATDVRTSAALESRLLVAGGGGGGGGWGNAQNGDAATYLDLSGGTGGDAGTDGGDGTSTPDGYPVSTAGTGGVAGCTATPVAECGVGGVAGTWTPGAPGFGHAGVDGNPGTLGNGGTQGSTSNAYGGYGGGGGGGYWGGGAGGSAGFNHPYDETLFGDSGGGGGGGGSSFVEPGAFSSSVSTRPDDGHGSVTISWIVDSDQDLIDDEGPDRCDTRPSATPDGCPDATRTLSIGYVKAKGQFFGWLASPTAPPCKAFKVVRLWKVQPGPDLLYARATTSSTGKWVVTKGFRYGSAYYATTPRVLQPDVATCLFAQSLKLRFSR